MRQRKRHILVHAACLTAIAFVSGFCGCTAPRSAPGPQVILSPETARRYGRGEMRVASSRRAAMSASVLTPSGKQHVGFGFPMSGDVVFRYTPTEEGRHTYRLTRRPHTGIWSSTFGAGAI